MAVCCFAAIAYIDNQYKSKEKDFIAEYRRLEFSHNLNQKELDYLKLNLAETKTQRDEYKAKVNDLEKLLEIREGKLRDLSSELNYRSMPKEVVIAYRNYINKRVNALSFNGHVPYGTVNNVMDEAAEKIVNVLEIK